MLIELLVGAGPLSEAVRQAVMDAGQRRDTIHIPFTCLGETWRTLTEPRGYGLPPEHIQLLLARTVGLMPALMPGSRFNERWLAIASIVQPRGAAIFDVQIAALCLQNHVNELWTFDQRFPVVDGLAVINPLIDRL